MPSRKFTLRDLLSGITGGRRYNYTAATSGTWTVAANWQESTPPANDVTSNIAVFNRASYSPGGSPSVGTSSVKGIQIGPLSATLTFIGTLLTIGEYGVVMENGAAAITLTVPVSMEKTQQWVVATPTGNPLTVGGILSGASDFNRAGSGLIILSGANTYTGSTILRGGVTRHNNASAIPGGIDVSGGLSTIILAGGILELAVANFARAQGYGIDQFYMPRGDGGWSAASSPRTVTVGTLVWGSSTFDPSEFYLNSAIASSSIQLIDGLNLGSTTRLVNVGANTATIAGVVSGAGGILQKRGSGTLVLNNAGNTFSGGVIVNAGGLTTDSNANLGTCPSIVFSGTTATWTMGINVTQVYAITMDVGSGMTVSLASGNALKTVTGVLSGDGSIVNIATTSFAFTNSANTFTGVLTCGYEARVTSIGDSSNPINVSNAANGFTWYGTTAVFALRPLTLQATGEAFVSNLGSGPITFQANVAISGSAGARTLHVRGTNTGDNTLSGIIPDGSGSVVSIQKDDAGTWILPGNNTFTGTVSIYAGTLKLTGLNQFTGNVLMMATLIVNTIGNYSSPSALGNPASGTPITFGYYFPSNIIYIGSGESSNRTLIAYIGDVSTRNNNSGVYNNGSGALTFTAAAFNESVAGFGARTNVLRLGGSYTGGVNDIQGVIIDNVDGPLLGINKVDASTWMLSGANTYTGTTTVSTGILKVTGSLASGSAVTVSGGTLLGAGTVSGTVTVDNVANSIIQGSATVGTLNTGALTFSGASARLKVGTNGSTACSLVASTGAVDLGGMTVNFDSALALDAGSYTLITGTSMSGSVVQGTLPIGRAWSSLSIVGNNLVAVLT